MRSAFKEGYNSARIPQGDIPGSDTIFDISMMGRKIGRGPCFHYGKVISGSGNTKDDPLVISSSNTRLYTRVEYERLTKPQVRGLKWIEDDKYVQVEGGHDVSQH